MPKKNNTCGGMPPKRTRGSDEEMREGSRAKKRGHQAPEDEMTVDITLRRSERERKPAVQTNVAEETSSRRVMRAKKSKPRAGPSTAAVAGPSTAAVAGPIVIQPVPRDLIKGINMTAIRDKRSSRSSSSRQSSSETNKLPLYPERLSSPRDQARNAALDRAVDKLVEKTTDVMHIEEDYAKLLDLPRIHRSPEYVEQYKILKGMLKEPRTIVGSIMQYKDKIILLHDSINGLDLSTIDNIKKMVKTLKEADITQKTLRDIGKVVETKNPAEAQFAYEFVKESLEKLYRSELKIWGDLYHRFSLERADHFNKHLETTGKQREMHLQRVAYLEKRLEDISDIIHKIRDDRYDTIDEMEFLYENEPDTEKGGDPNKGSLNILLATTYHMFAEEFLMVYEESITRMKELVTDQKKSVNSLEDLFKSFGF